MNEQAEVEVVTSVRVLRPYVLEVTFSDGICRQIDVESRLRGEVFEPLRDPVLFGQASVDAELGTVVWPNGADFAPEFLYYGPDTGTAEWLHADGHVR